MPKVTIRIVLETLSPLSGRNKEQKMKLEQFSKNWTIYFEYHMKDCNYQDKGGNFPLEETEEEFLHYMELFLERAKEQIASGETLTTGIEKGFSNFECAQRHPGIYKVIQEFATENKRCLPTTSSEALEMYLSYNGIIGYASRIEYIFAALKECEI